MGEGDGFVAICKIGTFLVILRTFFCLSIAWVLCQKWLQKGGGEKGAVVYTCRLNIFLDFNQAYHIAGLIQIYPHFW